MCVLMGKRKTGYFRERDLSKKKKEKKTDTQCESRAGSGGRRRRLGLWNCIELQPDYYNYHYYDTTTTTTTTRPYISSIVYTGWHWWPSTPSAFMDWPWHCKQSIYSGSHWKICLSLSLFFFLLLLSWGCVLFSISFASFIL